MVTSKRPGPGRDTPPVECEPSVSALPLCAWPSPGRCHWGVGACLAGTEDICHSVAAEILNPLLILKKAAILKRHCPLSSRTLAEPEAKDSGDSGESVPSEVVVASRVQCGNIGGPYGALPVV